LRAPPTKSKSGFFLRSIHPITLPRPCRREYLKHDFALPVPRFGCGPFVWISQLLDFDDHAFEQLRHFLSGG
jgi:hypothetical protein